MGGSRKNLRLLTTAQLARKLGVRPWTVRRLVTARLIQAINVSNAFYYQATLLPQYRGALARWRDHAAAEKTRAAAIAREAWLAQRAARTSARPASRVLPVVTITSQEQLIHAVADVRRDLTLLTARLNYLYRELGLLDTTPDTPVQ